MRSRCILGSMECIMEDKLFHGDCLELMQTIFPTEYVQGYTAALQDVINVFNYIDDDLKRHKRKRTAKTYQAIAKCMLDNRTILREEPDAFVRCNDKVDGGFEVYVAKRRTT